MNKQKLVKRLKKISMAFDDLISDLEEENAPERSKPIFLPTPFGKAQEAAWKRGIKWRITETEYKRLMELMCHYCGCDISPHKGIRLDRLNHDYGYHLDNVVSCCYACNTERGTSFTSEQFRVRKERP